MNTTENPNAFPLNDKDMGQCHPGMSLLDYFAGQALPTVLRAMFGGETKGKSLMAEAANASYNMAEMMLAERTKRFNA